MRVGHEERQHLADQVGTGFYEQQVGVAEPELKDTM